MSRNVSLEILANERGAMAVVTDNRHSSKKKTELSRKNLCLRIVLRSCAAVSFTNTIIQAYILQMCKSGNMHF